MTSGARKRVQKKYKVGVDRINVMLIVFFKIFWNSALKGGSKVKSVWKTSLNKIKQVFLWTLSAFLKCHLQREFLREGEHVWVVVVA